MYGCVRVVTNVWGPHNYGSHARTHKIIMAFNMLLFFLFCVLFFAGKMCFVTAMSFSLEEVTRKQRRMNANGRIMNAKATG